jgi:hypothetical protein
MTLVPLREPLLPYAEMRMIALERPHFPRRCQGLIRGAGARYRSYVRAGCPGTVLPAPRYLVRPRAASLLIPRRSLSSARLSKWRVCQARRRGSHATLARSVNESARPVIATPHPPVASLISRSPLSLESRVPFAHTPKCVLPPRPLPYLPGDARRKEPDDEKRGAVTRLGRASRRHDRGNRRPRHDS